MSAVLTEGSATSRVETSFVYVTQSSPPTAGDAIRPNPDAIATLVHTYLYQCLRMIHLLTWAWGAKWITVA